MEIMFVLILFLNYNIYSAGDPCLSTPCQHGGTCKKTKGNSYSCTCSAGFTGLNCETDSCDPNRCQNGGTCIRTRISYNCLCLAGFTGINCMTGTKNTTSTAFTTETSTFTTVYTAETSDSISTIFTTETSDSISTIWTTSDSIQTVVSTTEASSSTTSQLSTLFSSSNSTSVKSDESSPTATAKRQGDKTTIVVSVTLPVVVVVICGVIVGVCLIRRWKHKQGLVTTALERAPGISISNTSYGDHQVNVPKAVNGHLHDTTINDYAETVANGNLVNEQADGYYTINDVPKISQTNNTNYAQFNTHNALMFDSNYSHIENNNTKVSKTGDYGFSMFKRGIFQLKKSFKKDSNSSYENLEMKTVANSPNKTVKDVAMTEIESEYNHTQSGVHGTMKKDIQNEKDEYSHLDHKPKSLKADTNENPYSVQSKQISELSTNLRLNEYEHAVNIAHDYLVLQAVDKSGDDSIKESDKSEFEERNSNSAFGFQYEYAREVERSETYQNEEKRDVQSACCYELSKDIDTNEPADVDDSSATEDENQNDHYYILSKT